MTVSPQPCPDCGSPVRRFRSVPGRLRKLFKFRLYSCTACRSVLETSEVVTRITPADASKRYVSRVESNRHERRPRIDNGLDTQLVVDDKASVD